MGLINECKIEARGVVGATLRKYRMFSFAKCKMKRIS